MFDCPNSTNSSMDDVCDVHVNVGLTVDNFNMTTAGKLNIAFNDKWTIPGVSDNAPSSSTNKVNPFSSLINWFKKQFTNVIRLM